jgi:hypothetical protein
MRAACVVHELNRAALAILLLVIPIVGVAGRTNYVTGVAPQASNSLIQSVEQTLEGTLDIVYGDAKNGQTGMTLYTLSLANGTRLSLAFTGQAPPFSYFKKSVLVTGMERLGEATGRSHLLVNTIRLSAQQGPLTLAAVFGTKKAIMLLLQFSDDSGLPHPAGFYSDLINPATSPPGFPSPATVNGFYINNSWNQFHWIGDVGGLGGVPAIAWLTLPHPKSHYAPCGWSQACADLDAIAEDGTAGGMAAGIYFPQYDNINFVLSNDLDCCAWGGSWTGTLNGVIKTYGATWEPPWGQEAGTYSHEMGHSLGLPHSGWVYYAYDSPWDIMSARMAASNTQCGSYYSRNDANVDSLYCSNPGDDISGPYKDLLGWIDSSHETTIPTTPATTTVTLDGLAIPLGTPLKLVKICIPGYPCSGSGAHYFTVEARVTSEYGDGGLPGEGVIIHMFEADRPAVSGSCFFNSQSGPAWPVDSTPGDWDQLNCDSGGRTYPNYALFNAQWSPGQTYMNPAYSLEIGVVSRQGSTLLVRIGAGPSVTLSLTSGPPGTNVAVSGSDFEPSDTGCTISSSPGGLIANPTCTITSGTVSGSFTVGSVASGSYTVTVTGTPTGDVGSTSFNLRSAFGATCSSMMAAPARTVYFIFPDGNHAHVKPSGVGYASVTDWTALGYVYGMMDNMPQITALDTNSTYIDQTTGAPKIHDGIIVLFAGPLVNEAVHYYEVNRVAPLWWSLEGSWSTGTLYYRTRAGAVAASMPIQTVGGGSADMMLVEAFTDANGNTVLIFSGFGWEGTFTSGFYMKNLVYSGALAGMTDAWYFYSWTDKNGNGFVEDYEVSQTPSNHGN